MISELRKRVILDLMITPSTIIPFAGGVSLLLLSEMLGGFAAFLGVVGVLVGIGAFLTGLVFNLDKTYQKVLIDIKTEEAAKRKYVLDDLDRRLTRKRDQTALRDMRGIYDSFMEDLQAGKISNSVSSGMLTQIDAIFNACVEQLERQLVIVETSRKVSDDVRRKLLEQRDNIVTEVEKSVEDLAKVINEVRALRIKAERGELDVLRRRLDSQLQAAKATEQFVSGLGQEDLSRFSEYTTEKH